LNNLSKNMVEIMNIGKAFVARSVLVALAPLSVACSGTAEPNSEAVASTNQALMTAGAWNVAFQGNKATLCEWGKPWTGDTKLGVAPGTSPSIAALDGGGQQVAFQANGTHYLYVTGPAENRQTNYLMKSNASPSIAGLVGGGYLAAVEGIDNHLWIYGTVPIGQTVDVLAPNTNPSIAGTTDGGYEVAVQGTDNNLWLYGTQFSGPMNVAMQPGTSPSITALTGGGYEVAIQGQDGHLGLYGTLPIGKTTYVMKSSNSPSIAGLIDGGYEVAVQGQDNQLWLYGTRSSSVTPYVMRSGTNASIVGLADGGYEVAIQGNETGTGHMWVYGTAANGDTGNWMLAGTSPSISPIFSAPTGFTGIGSVVGGAPSFSLKWNAAPGATSYNLSVGDPSYTCSTYGLSYKTATGTSLVWGGGLGANGAPNPGCFQFSQTYTFYITACYPNGLCGQGSNGLPLKVTSGGGGTGGSGGGGSTKTNVVNWTYYDGVELGTSCGSASITTSLTPGGWSQTVTGSPETDASKCGVDIRYYQCCKFANPFAATVTVGQTYTLSFKTSGTQITNNYIDCSKTFTADATWNHYNPITSGYGYCPTL
jgi:hypothetical protein